MRGETCPAVDVAEGVGAARAQAAVVVVGEEFGFVSCDVHADRAFAFAAFAGEAKIERFFYLFAAPAVANKAIFFVLTLLVLALGHLKEQVGAAAGGVFFFAGGAVAGAHQAAIFATAFAHADASERGLGEAAVVGWKFENCLWLPGRIVRAEAQVFVELVGLDHFSGIHLPIGIPRRFKFAEGLDELGAKHFRKQFGAGLAVAVFAGDGAAIADDEVGGCFHELTEFCDTIFRLQVEVDAGVNAAVAEVAVERAGVTIAGHQLAQVAKIGPEFFRGDGGVFPAFPLQGFAMHVRSYA